MRIYLAHPFDEREAGKELQKYLEKHGFEVTNPFEREEQQIYNRVIESKKNFTKLQCKEIVEGDLDKIRDADIVVAMITNTSSIGTPMEIFFASYILCKPVVCLYTKEGTYIHPWIAYLTIPVTGKMEVLNKLKEICG